MTTLRSELLSSLKNYSRCNDELAIRVRETVLEPFQVDPSQLKTLKATPSPQEFKQMAVRLAPLAMNIVNQNSETLNRLKKEKPLKGANVVTGNCLIDSSFYALAALRHMNTLTTLKHLDIEKTTSNLISKIVDLGEYGRALYELVKFRLLLASVVKVSLVKQKKTTLPVSGNASRETSDNRIPKDMISNEWEQEMINKYQDLFQFPLDPTIDDPTTILLVLAYQMNTIRCFCEMKGGALAKYIPYLFDASGNFLDWCKLLSPIEPTIAKKQTEVVQKTFLKAFQRYQLNDGTTFYAYTLKCLVLKACLVSNTKKLKAILDNFVQSSLSYEKSNTKTNYQYIHKRCEILLEYIQPDPQDLSELDSYFVFCDFYAYVSRKTKSYQGTFYAFKHMIRPVRDMVGKPNVNSYYYSMYAATAKLSLCSVQMDKMAIDNCYIDVSTTFKETIQCMGLALQVAKEVQVGDNHSADALYHFYETADFFKQSAKRFYEFLREKAIQNVSETSNDPLRTPPRPGEIATPNNFGTWNTVAPQLNETLQVTSDCISSGIELIETKFEHYEKAFEMNTITTTFVEMMILSVRIKYQVEDERSYHQALEYLDKAEKFCSKTNFSKGNSWISSSYYSLGAAMIQLEMYSKATLPIRKSTILLSTHVESNPTDKNKLELCNRYEALGTCCFKVNEFREARESYRIALRQIPISKIKLFIDKGNSKAVSAISEEETLLPKLMDRFLRASIVDPNQASVTYACEHLQLSSFNDAEQCILFECELRVWSVLSLKANLSKFQLHIVNQLLEIYTPDIYPLRRIRVLLEQVRIERSKTNDRNGCLKKALECAVEAHELLKLKEYKKDVLLLYYRRHYLALSTSWIAICGYELQGKASYSFKIPFDHWNVLLRNIPTVYDSPTQISPKDKQKIYDEIDDVDKLYAHLRMLSDLFGLLGQYTYQINALRLLLPLNNGLRSVRVDFISGYNGKASAEYEIAKGMLAKNKCSAFTELTYLLGYSQYLTSINDFENSKKVFEKAKFVWNYHVENEPKNVQQTSKNYIAKSIILSDAYLAKSMVRSDTLDDGINNTTTALHILNRCLKTFQEDNPSGGIRASDPFSDDKSNKKNEESVSKAIGFKESQWKLAQKLTKCMETVSQLYLTKGSWNEAKYFVSQVINLAQRLQSKSMLHRAYVCSSDFNLRCGNLDKAQSDLEKAFSYKPEGPDGLHDQVYWDISMANLVTSKKMYTEALTLYAKANTALGTLLSSEHITCLEKFSSAKRSLNDTMDVDGKLDCIPISRMQSTNVIQIG
ncbi:hypothetical protein G6F56_002539 [Rhizopus delemar]|nr:hypothetical protein G6F56_002539 [Rhizopus delemar]